MRIRFDAAGFGTRTMKVAALVLLGVATLGAGQARAAGVVGLVNDFGDTATILTNNGFTVVDQPDLTQPITVDTLYLFRGTFLSAEEATNVRAYIEAGGCVITEFSATDMFFNGTLASFSGTLVDGFFVPSGDVGGGNTVVTVDPTSPLAAGLPGSFISGDPIGVFQVYSGLDPTIDTPLDVLGTDPYGDIPVVGTASIGAGHAIMFFSDFGDFFGGPFPNEEQLLINAANCDFGAAAVPEPATVLTALVGLPAGFVWARRRRKAA